MVRRLAWHEMATAERLAAASDGNKIEIRTAMMPITTSSSTSVKPCRWEVVLIVLTLCGLAAIKEQMIVCAEVVSSRRMIDFGKAGVEKKCPYRSEPSFNTARCQR